MSPVFSRAVTVSTRTPSAVSRSLLAWATESTWPPTTASAAENSPRIAVTAAVTAAARSNTSWVMVATSASLAAWIRAATDPAAVTSALILVTSACTADDSAAMPICPARSCTNAATSAHGCPAPMPVMMALMRAPTVPAG